MICGIFNPMRVLAIDIKSFASSTDIKTTRKIKSVQGKHRESEMCFRLWLYLVSCQTMDVPRAQDGLASCTNCFWLCDLFNSCPFVYHQAGLKAFKVPAKFLNLPMKLFVFLHMHPIRALQVYKGSRTSRQLLRSDWLV